MKRLYLVIAAAFLAAMAFGISKRNSYTDLVRTEHYLEQLQVAELPEAFAETTCEEMEKSLPNAAIIMRILASGNIEHLFLADRQKVTVCEVYAGDGFETGMEIYLTSVHWKLSLGGNQNSIERGFVNILIPGKEYLVFAEGIMEDKSETIPTVKLYDDFLMVPVFCCEERPNIAVPVSDTRTYVPYRDVMESEFFVTSEAAAQRIEKLKEKMLRMLCPQHFLCYLP